MQNNQFEAQLRELTDRIEALPEDQRGPLLALLDETRRRQQLIRQATDQARHALDDWRLMQKYLIFDHEARKRERGGNSNPPDDTSDQ